MPDFVGGPGFRLQRFWIVNGTGDHICAARPFSQINQPAALAAKRKFRLGAHYYLFTRGTAKAADALGHTRQTFYEMQPLRKNASLNYSGDQIIVMDAGDLTTVELARADIELVRAEIVNKNLAVNFGRVHLGAALP